MGLHLNRTEFLHLIQKNHTRELKKTDKPTVGRTMRDRIDQDIAKFLERGGQITQVPSGHGAMNEAMFRRIYDGTNHLAPPRRIFISADDVPSAGD